mmetsp:Transcript_24937/g.78984  ORF Transcript_24937/g.78984 Transcript_24937/m.78984 type:complete len:220 (-) Transcript_24937:409-1068(-)
MLAALTTAAGVQQPVWRARAQVNPVPGGGGRASLAGRSSPPPRGAPLLLVRSARARAPSAPRMGARRACRVKAGVGPEAQALASSEGELGWQGVHHVGLLCENLEKSLEFWHGLLGLPFNPDRPDNRLPYRGAWLWIGPEMVHLMELPNPDPAHLEFRPDHGGRDRHFCVGIEDLAPLVAKLEAAGVAYTASKSGRPAMFFRDPDCNTLEVVQLDQMWR